MRCSVCKKTSEEVKLFSGIMDSDMVMICEDCAEDNKVPIIRKPSNSQLNKADKRYSVRERMEIMSGVRDKTEISDDQMVLQGNLARLRSPPKKQLNENILNDYSWTIAMARRRKKMTTSYVASKIGVEPKIIQEIERGILPENLIPIFKKLEEFLGIKLLRMQKTEINFRRVNHDKEQEILESVRTRIDKGTPLKDDEDLSDEALENDEDIEISNKKDLSKVTIADLLSRKRRKELKELREKQKAEDESMMGEDLDLEIESL